MELSRRDLLEPAGEVRADGLILTPLSISEGVGGVVSKLYYPGMSPYENILLLPLSRGPGHFKIWTIHEKYLSTEIYSTQYQLTFFENKDVFVLLEEK